MSIGASRIYLGLVNSAEFNNPPVWATGVKEWVSSEPRIQFSDLSTHSSPIAGDVETVVLDLTNSLQQTWKKRDLSLGSSAV